MKTERRPEPTDPLPSQTPGGLSLLYQKYGTRLLVFITLIALAFAIIRYRSANNQRRLLLAQNALTQARSELEQLQEVLQVPYNDPEPVAMRRNQLFAQGMSDLAEVIGDAGDDRPILQAEYYATLGDLFWTMANAPQYPQAATRPSLMMTKEPDDFLRNAELDYQQIVDRYPEQQVAWSAAQLGLAAIAENRHDWVAAARHYQTLQARTDTADVYKQLAHERLLMLKDIQMPIQIGELTTQPSSPATTSPATTSPATTSPATTSQATTSQSASTQPASSQPATQPVRMPTVMPTTTPTTLPAR